ncbi:nuclear transport factor 2 family protein [Mycolicibacterium sp. XJ1819]
MKPVSIRHNGSSLPDKISNDRFISLIVWDLNGQEGRTMSEMLSQETTTTRAVIAAAYEAARTLDMPAIVKLLHPDVVLHEPASLANGGVHRGLENVLQALTYVFETFDMTGLEVEELVVDGPRAVGLITLLFRGRDGERSAVAEVWEVRDGQIVEIRPYYWDTKAITG